MANRGRRVVATTKSSKNQRLRPRAKSKWEQPFIDLKTVPKIYFKPKKLYDGSLACPKCSTGGITSVLRKDGSDRMRCPRTWCKWFILDSQIEVRVKSKGKKKNNKKKRGY